MAKREDAKGPYISTYEGWRPVKCIKCGKFISRKEIAENKAKFKFIPDSECGPEESYWEHVTC